MGAAQSVNVGYSDEPGKVYPSISADATETPITIFRDPKDPLQKNLCFQFLAAGKFITTSGDPDGSDMTAGQTYVYVLRPGNNVVYAKCTAGAAKIIPSLVSP